jgi:hypothetical protein
MLLLVCLSVSLCTRPLYCHPSTEPTSIAPWQFFLPSLFLILACGLIEEPQQTPLLMSTIPTSSRIKREGHSHFLP